MFHKLTSFAALFSIMTVLHSLVTAIPLPSLDLADLTRKSSLIAVGQVISVRDDGTEIVTIQGQSFSAKRKLAELQVARFLKGQVASQTVYFEFLTTTVYLGFGDIFTNQMGMFFLAPKSSNSLALTVTDLYYPSVVAAMIAPKASRGGYERVIAEVSNVLTMPQTTVDEKISAISVLSPIITPDTTLSLHSATSSINIHIRLRAVSALLKRNDISKLDIAEKALLQNSKRIDLNLIRHLASSLHGIKDTKAIATLARLLESDYMEARRSAAYALRQMNVSAVIKPLTKALYDSNREVRYQAVIGLAIITEQYSQGPSVDRYAANEQQFLTYWRDWAGKR
jgi:HEAT repeats